MICTQSYTYLPVANKKTYKSKFGKVAEKMIFILMLILNGQKKCLYKEAFFR